MEKENIFKPKIGNESLHQDSNDNGVRIVKCATSKLWLLRTRCSSTKIFISAPGPLLMRRLNQIGHILRDRIWHPSILDVCSFRGTDCDTDHYLVVAKVRESLVVSKQAAQKFSGEIFNLRKLNELQVRKQYQIETANRVVTLENLSDEEDLNRAWENIKENIKSSAKESLGLLELKQRKPCFYEECLHF